MNYKNREGLLQPHQRKQLHPVCQNAAHGTRNTLEVPSLSLTSRTSLRAVI